MVFDVKAFLEGIIHGVDGGFAIFVAVHGVDVGFLDKEENERERRKSNHNKKFWNREAASKVSSYHENIITRDARFLKV